MKIVKERILIDVGPFSRSIEWKTARKQIRSAIQAIEWPKGSGEFILYDQSGKKRGQGNGVKPIKQAFMMKLQGYGWELETQLDIATVVRPGAIDATCAYGDQFIAVEWETGNISSSHRALNKMSLGLLKRALIAGVLIVPTREMYSYLTDRVGNYRELRPYFPFWESIPVKDGLLVVIAVEHDGVSTNVPRIEKGTDGRALV